MTVWGSDGLTSGGDVLTVLERLKRTADAAALDLRATERINRNGSH